ncbi:SpoIIE family protein phosphatase [Oligoflexus tunisiensis]|uniref:SpoIIE family protein phosphatase n=1 Tax=Oligoflexus tunisiensis TaxID=708132 RepID=UPI00159F2863|nr:SpoIIE family protein phosphatase [Oligoflexus tunisiensis]
MTRIGKFGLNIVDSLELPGLPYRLVRAVRESDGQNFLVKIIPARHESVGRLRSEFALLRSLSLPLFPEAQAWEQDAEECWALYICPALTPLSQVLQRPGHTVATRLELSVNLVEALVELHKRGYILLNLNPWTCLVRDDDRSFMFLDASHMRSRSRRDATPPLLFEPDPVHWPYMAPEQTGASNQPADQRSDLYSMGLTLYQLFGGELSTMQKSQDECSHWHMTVIADQLVDRVLNFSPYVSAIVARLSKKQPAERYQTAWGVLQDLREALSSSQANLPDQMLSIGTRDVPDDLRFPDRIYGRDVEIAELDAVYQRFISGESVSLLVEGRAGIGKTRLLGHINDLSKVSGCLLARGSSVPDTTTRPFAPIMEAVDELVHHLLQKPQREMLAWRKKIFDSVGENVALMIQLCPDLALVLGNAEDIPTLPPKEEKIRFEMTLRNFIRTFCQREHPLILIFEQGQWLDSGTLDMLDAILRGDKAEHLFLIFTYATDTKNVRCRVENLSNLLQTAFVHHAVMHLHPLSTNNISRLLAELFMMEQDRVEDLAAIIFQKTGGIPLFVRNMIQGLTEQGAISFDYRRFCYFWNLSIAQQWTINDSMVNHVLLQLQKLQPGDVDLIGMAACIGREFRVNDLQVVAGQDIETVRAALARACERGLVFVVNDESREKGTDKSERLVMEGTLRFAHEAIREVASGELTADVKRSVHRAIAEQYMLQVAESGQQDRLFSIVDHFNHSVDHSQPCEDIRLAEMNLGAARKARLSASFAQALAYLRKAILYLGDNPWEKYYRQCLAIHEEMAIGAFLNQNKDLQQAIVEEALKHTRDKVDTIVFHEMKIAEIMSRDLEEALDYAIPVLIDFGFKFPRNPGTFRVGCYLIRAIALMKTTNYLRRLENVGHSHDLLSAAAIRIATRVGSAAYLVRPNLMPVLAVKGFELGLKHGHVPSMPFAYAGLATILLSVFGHYRDAFRLARYAEALVRQFEDKQQQCRVDHMLHSFIYPWSEPMRHSLIGLLKAFRNGVEYGEYEFAIHAINLYCHYSFYAGSSLLRLEEEVTEYRRMVGDLHHNYLNAHTEMARQTLMNLCLDSGETTAMLGPIFDHRKHAELLVKAPDFTFYYATNSIVLCTLYHDLQEGFRFETMARKHKQSAMGSYGMSVYRFYAGILLARAATNGLKAKWSSILKLKNAVRIFKRWMKYVPQNQAHRYHLLRAELQRLQGKTLQALASYAHAIRAAEEAGVQQDLGLACEQLACLFHGLGLHTLAQDYLRKAFEAYQRWGATKLVNRLKEHYRSWQLAESPSHGLKVAENSYDLQYLQRVLSEMTRETTDAHLMTRILSSSVHLAGADCGHFILKSFDDNTYRVRQSFNDSVITQADKGFMALDTICKSLVNYVIRTRRSVVVADAQVPQKAIPGLERDPYVMEKMVRSLACIPIEIGSGAERELIAIIYLENSVSSHVFTQERLRLLELVGQATAGRLELSEKAHTLEASLKEAQLVQQALFPTIKRLGSFAVADYFKAADHTGGDWYGYYEEDTRDRAYFFIGDVTGHGVSSALITGTAAGSVYGSIATLQAVQRDMSLTETTEILANCVNRAVYDTAAKVDKFMTMVFVSFDSRTGEVAFINAGHPNGFIISDYKVKPLLGRGSPLGFHRDPIFKVQRLQLQPGDILFFYTDGLIENEGPEGEKLHPRDLARILEVSREPDLIKQQLLKQTDNIWQNRKAADDYAFVIIRWDGWRQTTSAKAG